MREVNPDTPFWLCAHRKPSLTCTVLIHCKLNYCLDLLMIVIQPLSIISVVSCKVIIPRIVGHLASRPLQTSSSLNNICIYKLQFAILYRIYLPINLAMCR